MIGRLTGNSVIVRNIFRLNHNCLGEEMEHYF